MHCAIVGMGLLGRVLALSLIRTVANSRLTCIDKAVNLYDKTSCGYAAAGMVSPLAELTVGDYRLYQQGCHSLILWQQIADYIGASNIFSPCGSLIVTPRQSVDDFYHFYDRLNRFDEVREVMRVLSVNESAAIEPQLNYHSLHREILHLPTEAVIRVPRFFKASAEVLSRDPKVEYQSRALENVSSLLTEYDVVFDTRGLGAKDDLPQLRGVRGEAMVVHAPDVSIQSALRLLHPRYPLYVVPRGHGYYYVGATSIDAEDDSPISLKSQMELSSALYCLASKFSEARIIKTITHCRPTLDSAYPQVIDENRLFRINGFYRHGYLLAPAFCHQLIEKHFL